MAWPAAAYAQQRVPRIGVLLIGGPEFRTLVDRGEPIEDWLQQDARAALDFAQQRQSFLLY